MPRIADCGGIEDRRRHQRAVHAAVGDAEGAAGELLELERALARALAEIRGRAFDLGEAHAFGIADHRDDEAVRAADGDAHVDEVPVDDVLAVDLGVGGGEFGERRDAGADEEAHEAEPHAAVLLLESVAVLGADRHDGAHVHLVEGGEHGGGVLRFLEADRDGAAQARHPHALLAGLGLARGLGGEAASGRGWRGRAVEEGEHVALGDPPVLAGAGADGGGAGLCFSSISLAAAGSGAGEAAGGGGFGGRWDRCGPRDRAGGAGGSRTPASGAGFAGGRSAIEPAQHRADRDLRAGFGRDLGEHARGRRLHLHRHLVGFQLDQRLIHRHRLAGLLQPSRDGGGGDALAERRAP